MFYIEVWRLKMFYIEVWRLKMFYIEVGRLKMFYIEVRDDSRALQHVLQFIYN